MKQRNNCLPTNKSATFFLLPYFNVSRDPVVPSDPSWPSLTHAHGEGEARWARRGGDFPDSTGRSAGWRWRPLWKWKHVMKVPMQSNEWKGRLILYSAIESSLLLWVRSVWVSASLATKDTVNGSGGMGSRDAWHHNEEVSHGVTGQTDWRDTTTEV